MKDGGYVNRGGYSDSWRKSAARGGIRPLSDAAAEEGAGEGGPADIPPPAWRRRATMIIVVAGERTGRRSGGGNDVFVMHF